MYFSQAPSCFVIEIFTFLCYNVLNLKTKQYALYTIGEKVNERRFSCFLENFLKDRNLAVASLATQMKISNKTIITRILNDKATINNIKSFAEKLQNHFDITDEDRAAIEAAINHEQLPDSVVTARQVLSGLFSKKPEQIPNRLKCTLKNAEECKEEIFLYDEIYNILNDSDGNEYEIFIESVNTLAFTHALFNILHDGKRRKITIHQYFSDTDDVTENIHQLYTLIKLSQYIHYFPYVISPSIINSSRLNIINRTKNKAYLINIYNTTNYTMLEMDVGGTNYAAHTLSEFEILKSCSTPLRECFDSPIDSLPEYLDQMAKLDGCVTYEMKSSPCFGMLPFEVQKALYADSDYLGLGIENPMVQRMYKTMESREKALYQPNGPAKNIVFDKNGMKLFLENGRTSDHVPVFRSLTAKEAVFYLKKLMENENARIYLLKDDYCVKNNECVLFESNSLIVFDPALGYWDNFSEISVKNKKMLRIMRDFINEEIIKNCCYSLEESKAIINDMIK